MDAVLENLLEMTPEERCDRIAELFLHVIQRMNAGEPPPAPIPVKKAYRVKFNAKKTRGRQEAHGKTGDCL